MTLLDWIIENGPLSTLEETSMATGIDLPSLKRINEGSVIPSEFHVKALKKIFPKLPAAVLTEHAPPRPEYISTRRGMLPEGTALSVGQVKDLRAGDYVPYEPQTRESALPGSHWVEVRSVSPHTAAAMLVDFGGVQSGCHPELSIRFARRR